MLERLGQPEDGFRLVGSRHRGDQRLRRPSRRGPVLGELGRHLLRRARQLRRQPPVELLALAWQQRPIDRLGQQRVPEPEGPGRLVPHQHATIDGPAQRLAQLVLGQIDHRPQQRVGHVAAGGGSDAQHVVGLGVQLRDPLEQHVPQDAGQIHATLAGGGQQLFGKERVALGAGDDRLRQRRLQPRPAAVQQQGLHLLAVERSQLQPRRHAGAEQTRHQPAEPMLGRQFVAAVGPDQQHPPPAEVVRQEGDQVQGRAVRPVQVLQDQDDGFGGRDRIQQHEQLLQQPELRSRRTAAPPWVLLT